MRKTNVERMMKGKVDFAFQSNSVSCKGDHLSRSEENNYENLREIRRAINSTRGKLCVSLCRLST